MTFKVLKAVHVNVTLLCNDVVYSYVKVSEHQILSPCPSLHSASRWGKEIHSKRQCSSVKLHWWPQC